MSRGLKMIVSVMWALGSYFFVAAQNRSLSYYLQQGLTNSPLLKDYQHQLKVGALDSSLIRAAHRPQVLANGQVMVAPTFHGYGYDVAITNGGNYAAVVSASQPLFTKHILAPQYRGIALQNLSTSNTAQISKLDIKKNITAGYITGYADYQQLLSNEEVYDLLQTQQEILQKLVQTGSYKQTDYLNFKVALQSQEITISQLRMQYKADIAALNYLCGINDTGSVSLNAPEIYSINNNGDKTSSVFFKRFRIDSLKIINDKALTDAKYKASLNWFADAGFEASDPGILYKSFGTSFGLNLSVPIYDGKQRDLEYQKNKLTESTREDYAAFFNNQYDQQRAMLEQQLHASEHLVTQIKEKLSDSRLLMKLDKAQLNTGDLRITDYIMAINNYLSIKNNLNQEEINRFLLINQLNYWKH
ncbi:MAG TPA: TolC family protein [Chitinophagaceae bacterium]|nr:TolC family protein [Chitinophagaceae bacterium]